MARWSFAVTSRGQYFLYRFTCCTWLYKPRTHTRLPARTPPASCEQRMHYPPLVITAALLTGCRCSRDAEFKVTSMQRAAGRRPLPKAQPLALNHLSPC